MLESLDLKRDNENLQRDRDTSICSPGSILARRCICKKYSK